MRVRRKLPAAAVEPALLRLIADLCPDGFGTPVLLFLRDEIAALEDEDARVGLRQRMRHRPAAHPAADDHDVEAVRHRLLAYTWSMRRWSSIARSRLISGARRSRIEPTKSWYIAR